MKNGLYSASFKTPFGEGGGVVMLLNGQLSGGDSSMYYVGTYAVSGDKFTAEVKTARHHQGPVSVFGKDQVTIRLTGTISGDSLQANGSAAEAPGVGFSARLDLLAVGG
ncbi:hypothetical protein A5906_07265 [Bradyrhizobium sacchari]|uniref:Type III secretion system (T3SS) negative regulator GrlR n=1 Tax=Bradyrhizobium sacchari TaxID=1399419 RepID=A0A560KKS6_9BRAD|nr:GrlR family regulatory protein [Bradyrhizobium sacchari]OPY95760.1 hypothetical protein A5906_07265 [Bradyrhizobium sacchari]TWB66625.1 type III secretion system (T3SS) negative regulator GrlR [Bradyrhizobium sacchari]TWB83861.1 type III secretion system (T3SS) negative regulator GrlR [Bradyrhizobium sacchari]